MKAIEPHRYWGRKRKIGDSRESRIERLWINYTDTAETNAMRDDVRRINAWIERASITFIDDEGDPVGRSR